MVSRFREFTLLLSKISKCITRIKNKEMKKYNLKGNHVNCLFLIYESDGPVSATDICQLSDEDKGQVSRTLKELEENGYIICEYDANKKKYNSALKLTPKGKKIAEFIVNEIESIINYKEDYISDVELKNFYITFNKIYKNMEKFVQEGEK